MPFAAKRKHEEEDAVDRRSQHEDEEEDAGTDDEGLEHLFENNRRWVARKLEGDKDYFKKMTQGQKPRFLIIGCADSRVPVVEILGLPPGECFTHRNVANLVVTGDLNFLSVLTYAVEHLGVQDIIVCGHYFCGGVKAALSDTDHGLLEHWVRNIRDVVYKNIDEMRELGDENQRLQRLVELNVKEQCINLFRNPCVQKKQAETGIYPRIHGMVYDLRDGYMHELKVDFVREVDENHEIYGVLCKPTDH